MGKEIYKNLLENLASRGANRAGAFDIPEFYALAVELFTPEEATVASLQSPGSENWATAIDIAKKMGKSEDEVSQTLESMAYKGTCTSIVSDGIRY